MCGGLQGSDTHKLMWNEGTLQIYVTAANDVRMRMDEIMIEMHSAEMIVKGTENVGKCEAQESCKAC